MGTLVHREESNGAHSFSTGDRVRLNVPENGRLHGTEAIVVILTPYGAMVHAPAAATGQFRALFSEMVFERQCSKLSGRVEQGYTGDICQGCGGSRMKRTGRCVTCEDCGHNEGCG